VAASHSSLSTVRRLLAHARVAATIDARDDEGRTTLWWSCLDDWPELVTALLAAGADATIPDRTGHTPLMVAVKRRNMAVLRVLLADPLAAATVDCSPRPGETPLWLVACRGHVAMVQALLEGGADPQTTSEFGCTPLMAAALNGRVRTIRALLVDPRGAATLDWRDQYGDTALHLACIHGKAAVARALLVAGADALLANTRTYTPLELASPDLGPILQVCDWIGRRSFGKSCDRSM
jgi:uncharacterized protein